MVEKSFTVKRLVTEEDSSYIMTRSNPIKGPPEITIQKGHRLQVSMFKVDEKLHIGNCFSKIITLLNIKLNRFRYMSLHSQNMYSYWECRSRPDVAPTGFTFSQKKIVMKM